MPAAESGSRSAPGEISDLISLLRCLECGSGLELLSAEPGGYPALGPDGRLECSGCGEAYPLIGGTPRMLRSPLRRILRQLYPRATAAFDDGDGAGATCAALEPELEVKQRTGESFAYEWEHFGALRDEWRKNFLDYMRPHSAHVFDGLLVLDLGTGSGRHSFQASELGARVVAVDLGQAIDVARENLPASSLTVQADAEDLPFALGTFDLVMSIGVLHHLPDPERAFRAIVPYARPGGWVQIYLYWRPPRRAHRMLLKPVTALRRITVMLPHRLLHVLSYPTAALLFAVFVLPHRALRRRPRGRRLADAFPLKTYADYPFKVCVNDQFDRFSAPLEHRYEEPQVRDWLRSAGLEEVSVLPNHGWLGSGRRPTRSQ